MQAVADGGNFGGIAVADFQPVGGGELFLVFRCICTAAGFELFGGRFVVWHSVLSAPLSGRGVVSLLI